MEQIYNEAVKREKENLPDFIEGDRLVSVNEYNIKNGVYEIPKQVKRIDPWAFKNQKSLRKNIFII